jgi:hypothetical protein
LKAFIPFSYFYERLKRIPVYLSKLSSVTSAGHKVAFDDEILCPSDFEKSKILLIYGKIFTNKLSLS